MAKCHRFRLGGTRISSDRSISGQADKSDLVIELISDAYRIPSWFVCEN